MSAVPKRVKRLRLIVAAVWTASAAAQIAVVAGRYPSFSIAQIVVLALSVFCAVIWWYSYLKMRKIENNSGGNNHE